MSGRRWMVPVFAALAGPLVACGSGDGPGDATPEDGFDEAADEAEAGVDGDGGESAEGDEDATAEDDPGEAEAPPDDGGADDAGAEEGGADDRVADFVIDALRLGNQALGEGFDLDGLDTPPGDPLLPPDGPGGVDNGFSALVLALEYAGLDFDLDAEIAARIASGDLLLLLRHREVDDWASDPNVPLHECAGHDTDGIPANNLTGDGELLVDERSLGDPADEWSTLTVFADGALEDTSAADSVLQDGDFEASAPVLNLRVPIETIWLDLTVYGVRIVWDLESAPSGSPPVGGRLRNGLVGGHMLVDDVVGAFLRSGLFGTIDPLTLQTILLGQADMDVIPAGFSDVPCSEATVREDCAPGQTCESDPARGGASYCHERSGNPDALSIGLVFHAVSCRVTGVWDDPSYP